jgi:diguanylate cyclase (GGDEF)-like protein
VLILDIDHFKQINDTHGHAAGDAVLRECARAWQGTLREQDVLGRIGGEEFCAFLPETTREGALHSAERLREATSRLKFPGRGGEFSFSVTVSVGVAALGTSDEQLAQLIDRADGALYVAKQRGRDRVEFDDASRPGGAAPA